MIMSPAEFGLSVEVFILGCLAVVLAAFTMSLTGFGFALIAAPLLLFLLESKTVVVVNIILVIVICLLILWKSRHHAKAGRIVLLAIGSICGIPLGVYMLSHTSAATLKLLMASLVVVFAVPLALGHSHHFRKEKLGSVISGFISGTLTSSTSLADPPVVIFLLNQGWEKESFRANLAAYFLLSNLIALAALRFSGVVTSDLLAAASTFIPAVLLGFYLSTKVAPRVDAILFRRIAISVVLLAGLVGIGASLLVLL